METNSPKSEFQEMVATHISSKPRAFSMVFPIGQNFPWSFELPPSEISRFDAAKPRKGVDRMSKMGSMRLMKMQPLDRSKSPVDLSLVAALGMETHEITRHGQLSHNELEHHHAINR